MGVKATPKFKDEGEGGRVRYGLACPTTLKEAHAAIPSLDGRSSYFGVYHGYGGNSVAKFCAKYLHKQLLKFEEVSSDDLATSVKKAYLRMDEMIRDEDGWKQLMKMGTKAQQLAGFLEGSLWFSANEDRIADLCWRSSGSTACVCIIRNDELTVGNVGDSRCIISTKGQSRRLSRDHKSYLATEIKRIEQAGGYIMDGLVNGYLSYTRAIGNIDLKGDKQLALENQIISAEAEVITVKLSKDDEFIVLASCDLWDHMSSQEVVDFVHEKLSSEDISLSAICENLVDRASKPGTDTIVILILLNKETNSVSATNTKQHEPDTTGKPLADEKKVSSTSDAKQDTDELAEETNSVSATNTKQHEPDTTGKPLADEKNASSTSDAKQDTERIDPEEPPADEPKVLEPDLDEVITYIAISLLSVRDLVHFSDDLVHFSDEFEHKKYDASVRVLNGLIELYEVLDDPDVEEVGQWRAVIGQSLNKILKLVFEHVRYIREEVSDLAGCSLEAPTIVELVIKKKMISISLLLELGTIIADIVAALGESPLKEGKILRAPICGFAVD